MLEMKNIVREMKKTLNGLIIGLYIAKERISELKNQPMKITQIETQRTKEWEWKSRTQHPWTAGQY